MYVCNIMVANGARYFSKYLILVIIISGMTSDALKEDQHSTTLTQSILVHTSS